MQQFGIEIIRKTTRRLPFGQSDLSSILAFLNKERKHGLIVKYHSTMGKNKEEWLETLNDGILILACPQLEQDFLFVQEENGRGLLGGQKRIFRVYLGEAANDDFSPGPVFKNLTMALFSINNVFRGNGLLQGGAF